MTNKLVALALAFAWACPVGAQEINTKYLSENGWFSDDTRADGSGSLAEGTNLVSDSLTDEPEASAVGTSAHDGDILGQILLGLAPGTVPATTHEGAATSSSTAAAAGRAPSRTARTTSRATDRAAASGPASRPSTRGWGTARRP